MMMSSVCGADSRLTFFDRAYDRWGGGDTNSKYSVIFQSCLFPCCLRKILGVVHPCGAFLSPARIQILFRSSSNLFCFFLPLPSSTLFLRNLVLFCSFLYLCRFIFRRRTSRSFLHLRGVAEPSPSSKTGTKIGGRTFSSSASKSSCGGADSSKGGRE